MYLEDAGGNEKTQLYYQRLGEPGAKLLTDGKSLNGGPVWSNAGREIAFFSTARDGVSYDIDIVDPESGALPRLAITGDSAAWYPLDWSPDDRKLLVLKYVSISEAYLYVVDLGTGQKREVEPAPAKVGIAGAKFSRDGQGVYVISNRDGEFAQLRYVNLFTGEKTVISGRLSWDIEELAISRDGHYLAYVSNEAGIDKLNVLDLRSHQDLIPPQLPAAGIISSLSFDAEGGRLAFGFAAANRPRDAYVLDIATNHLEAWTHSEAGAVDLAKFVTPRLAHFPTFDRTDGRERQMPVYIYEPSTPGPHPVLIVLHGGPESQFRPGFDPWLQYVVNELGFAVVAPNVRGSSGYGKTYLALDNGMLREDAVKDVGALLVWLSLQNRVRRKARRGVRRILRRLSGARDPGQFRRSPARRRRPVRHHRLRQLSDQYRALRPRSAPRGIRRRTRSGHARLPAAHFTADERRAHYPAVAHRARQERSSRAAERSGANRLSAAQQGRRGLVSAGRRRRPRLAQKPTATPTTGRSRNS